jgi:hypothetical protein
MFGRDAVAAVPLRFERCPLVGEYVLKPLHDLSHEHVSLLNSVSGIIDEAALVNDNLGVTDGNVGSALVKIAQRIPTGSHHFTHDPVGFGDSRLRVIHETILELAPGVRKPCGVSCAQRLNSQALDPPGPGLQYRLGAPGASKFPDRPLIFRTEPVSQTLAATFLDDEP